MEAGAGNSIFDDPSAQDVGRMSWADNSIGGVTPHEWENLLSHFQTIHKLLHVTKIIQIKIIIKKKKKKSKFL